MNELIQIMSWNYILNITFPPINEEKYIKNEIMSELKNSNSQSKTTLRS